MWFKHLNDYAAYWLGVIWPRNNIKKPLNLQYVDTNIRRLDCSSEDLSQFWRYFGIRTTGCSVDFNMECMEERN